ncbi:ribonuclease P protein component [Candidatus Wolfebacteria bacterium]|nr:MAG: ribonuclease P protein component [Candidatus Wolfebacteria bacterium]
MLKRKNRLPTITFKEVLNKGRNYHSDIFSIKMVKSTKDYKFSVVVPKAVEKNAVKRNHIRGRIRSIVEEFVKKHPNKKAVVIIFAKKGSKTVGFTAIEEDLTNILTKHL